MEKKEINANTSVKAIITGFIAYGIILFFICFFVLFLINTLINSFANANQLIVSITFPLLSAIFIYFVIHALCRLSTYDVFKKCVTSNENIDNISRKMNLFFIICIMISVLLSIIFLSLKLDSLYKMIQITQMKYSQVFSNQFTQQLTDNMLKEYYTIRAHSLISTIIMELGFIVSFFSLIPYQKKMIKTYNQK